MNILESALSEAKNWEWNWAFTQGIRQRQLKALVRSVELAMKNFNIDLPKWPAGLEMRLWRNMKLAKEAACPVGVKNPPVKKIKRLPKYHCTHRKRHKKFFDVS